MIQICGSTSETGPTGEIKATAIFATAEMLADGFQPPVVGGEAEREPVNAALRGGLSEMLNEIGVA